MKTLPKSAAVALALALALAGCSSGSGASSDAATGVERTITDDAGRSVTLPAEITRVAIDEIPIESTYLSYFDGGAPYIVGMSAARVAALQGTIVADMAPEMLRADTSYNTAGEVNVESLLNLDVDVVLYNANNSENAAKYEAAGITAVGFTTTGDPASVYADWMRLLEQVFDEPGRMDAKIAYADAIAEDARQRAAGVAEGDRKSAVTILGSAGGQLQIAGGRQGWFTDSWARRLSFDNATSASDTTVSLTTMEQIIDWNPDVILLAGKGMSDMTPATVTSNSVAGVDFSPLRAYQDGAVHSTGLGMWNWFTPNPDAPLAAEWLGEQLYPDRFSDVDLDAKVKEYYRTMYGYELSDQQAARILDEDADA